MQTPKFLLTLLLALPLAGQQPSAAEAAYRDAWWAESGQGDLAAALKGYLAAAAADGPAGIRARALLGAGLVQQRLGKTDSAIASLRQLLQQYPGEAELVERARAQLRELTAVDLRQNYDEWYERRLFSEDVQLQILQKLQALGDLLARPPRDQKQQGEWYEAQRALVQEIRGFGKGALPALRKAAEAPTGELAGRAVGMLFDLGEVPSAPALQRHFGDWAGSAEPWTSLLALHGGAAQQLANGIREAAPGATLLRAAVMGHGELAAAVVGIRDAELVREQAAVLAAATCALLRRDGYADDQERLLVVAQVLDGLAAETTPLRVRRAMEQGILECEPPPLLDPEMWLQLGKDPLHFELRYRCIEQATAGLQPGDGDELDELLARVAAMPKSGRETALYALTNGLEHNLAPTQLPWTPARLRRLLGAFVDLGDPNLSQLFAALLHTEAWRAMLAEALLGDPVPMREVYPAGDGSSLAIHLQSDGSDEEVALLQSRWNRAVADRLGRDWAGFDAAQRLAALVLLRQVVNFDHGDRAPLLQFLAKADRGGNSEVGAAIEQLQQDWGR